MDGSYTITFYLVSLLRTIKYEDLNTSSFQAQQEELRRRTYRRKLFVEQGERVAQRYPGSSEEICWRVNYLNNKWDQLESTFTPAKGRNQEVEVELGMSSVSFFLFICFLKFYIFFIHPAIWV